MKATLLFLASICLPFQMRYGDLHCFKNFAGVLNKEYNAVGYAFLAGERNSVFQKLSWAIANKYGI